MSVVDDIIERARQTKPPRPAEDLPIPEKVITPSGDRLRIVIVGAEHDQVFEAADYQELSNKLVKSLTHANRFIDRLCSEKRAMKDALSKVVGTYRALIKATEQSLA